MKVRLYSTCVCSIMSYGSETSPVKEEYGIRLERDDARMVRWMCSIRPERRISAGELKTRLKLNSTRECLKDRILQSFGHLEKMEENACLVNEEPLGLVVAFSEDDLGKYGMG